MNIETLREYCIGLTGTTEDIKWDDHLCFLIEGKIYLMTSLTAPHSFSMKVDPADFDALVSRVGISQAAYMAKRQWVLVENLSVLPEPELKNRIRASRALVLSKLTKKIQEKYA